MSLKRVYWVLAVSVSLVFTVLLLMGIVWMCSIFTNAIEWLGHRYNLSQGAVGSVLAAVGTALPETLVPLIAVIQAFWIRHQSGGGPLAQSVEHIGVGAILGAPFLLSTLGFFISGVAVYYFAAHQKRGRVFHLDLHLFKRDLRYFLLAYTVVLAASFIASAPVKWALALALLSFYGVYVYRTLSIDHIPDTELELEPLIFAPDTKTPASGFIIVQTLIGLAGIIVLAKLFIGQIQSLSDLWHFSPMLLSLIMTPIATELPEKFNSVMWISKKKDNLALGNITGSLVFQSCIPTAIGLCFTPWVFNTQGMLSVLLCFASVGCVYGAVVSRRILTPGILLVGGGFYVIFLVYIFMRWG